MLNYQFILLDIFDFKWVGFEVICSFGYLYIAFFLYLCLLSLSNLQDCSFPKPFDKSSTRGRE